MRWQRIEHGLAAEQQQGVYIKGVSPIPRVFVEYSD